jgi:hypothetical protein
MTPEEIQRTMDFNLKIQADLNVGTEQFRENDRLLQVRQDRLDRQQKATQNELDTLVSVTRDLVTVSRQTLHRVQDLEAGDR